MAEIIVDASGYVLGRLASNVAKLLIKGESIVIVNAEKAVVSGKRDVIVNEYSERMNRGDPYHGPFYPKQPHLMLRRTVRGMLPKNARGRAMLKNLRVHAGIPSSYQAREKIKFANASSDKIIETQVTTLEEINNSIVKGRGRHG